MNTPASQPRRQRKKGCSPFLGSQVTCLCLCLPLMHANREEEIIRVILYHIIASLATPADCTYSFIKLLLRIGL
jgi:hypothetical protein